jgi:hypothetical protein
MPTYPTIGQALREAREKPVNWEAKYYTLLKEFDHYKVEQAHSKAGLRGQITRLNNEIKKLNKK